MNADPNGTVRFGIFGLGMVADFHARAIAQVQGARLVAVANRNPEKGREFARRHGVGFAGSSIEDLVGRSDVDVICITTSSGAHLEPALAAIGAGKHVVIEKPIEITVERVDAILRAADAAGVWVGPIFQARFGDGARTVKAAIDAGRLGRIGLASAYIKWHRPASYYAGTRGTTAADGGGALMAQGIHALDLLQWFVGLPVEVCCRSTRRVHLGIEVEDTAAAAIRFADGALGAIEASTAVWPGWRRRLELCGEQGSIALEDDEITRWEFRAPQPGDEAVGSASGGNALGSGASSPSAISLLGHQRQLQDFVDALRAGRRPALVGRDGRNAVLLVQALYESAARGVPLRVLGTAAASRTQ